MNHSKRTVSGQENPKKTHTCARFCNLFCILALCALLLSACGEGKRTPNVSELFRSSFSAEVEITKNGQELLAQIEASTLSDGKRRIRVSYRSGGVLCGVTVEGTVAALDGGTEGSCIEESRVTCGELVLSLPDGTAEGLLLPVTSLLKLTTVSSVQKGSDGSFTLSFDGDRTLVVTSAGTPTAFTSPDLCLRILEFASDARF